MWPCEYSLHVACQWHGGSQQCLVFLFVYNYFHVGTHAHARKYQDTYEMMPIGLCIVALFTHACYRQEHEILPRVSKVLGIFRFSECSRTACPSKAS